MLDASSLRLLVYYHPCPSSLLSLIVSDPVRHSRSYFRRCIPVLCVFCHIGHFIFPVHTFTPAAAAPVAPHPRAYLYRLLSVDIRLLVPCFAPHPSSCSIPSCYVRRTCPIPTPSHPTPSNRNQPAHPGLFRFKFACARIASPPLGSIAVVVSWSCTVSCTVSGSVVLAHVVCTLQSARSLPVSLTLPCFLPLLPFADPGCHS